ncbi:MAG: serine/threonine protein kinase [Phycisphaerae bacterium]|nr:serine/threonine protein kinase [Phycisphaerae bacterium]
MAASNAYRDDSDSTDAARRHLRLSVLFTEARQRPPHERLTWLTDECSDDPELLTDLRSLLAIDEAGTPLDDPVLSRTAAVTSLLADNAITIPGYHVGAVLGEGGMGTVFEADQFHPRRRVAIKVLQIADRDRQRRFEREADVLARLHHPGIVPIFAAGFTAHTALSPSRPFIAMELVQGLPIDRHIDETSPSPKAIVRLFVQICEAIHHAHVNGVVHRDLKPSNILIDAAGRPRILDFGVARLVEGIHDEADATIAPTRDGQVIGTLRWMSPEQIGAGGADQGRDVGPRSDVYAIGLLLHAALGGAAIFPPGHLTLAEAVRIIRDVEPLPLGRTRRELRGDLEAIVSMALRKASRERYPDAAALGRDLERWLDGEQVSARRRGTLERAKRFAAQNTLLVGVVGTAILALGAGLAVTVAALGDARRQRDAALRETATSEASIEFLSRVLRGADPMQQDPHAGLNGNPASLPTVQELLDQASAALPETVADQPELELKLRLILGETYSHFGLHGASEAHFVRALELAETTLGPDDPQVTYAAAALAMLFSMQDRIPEARALVHKIKPTDTGGEYTARRLLAIGMVLIQSEEFEGAIETFDGALATLAAAESADPDLVWAIKANLLAVLVQTDRLDRAEATYRDLLAADLGLHPSTTLTIRCDYGRLLFKLGRRSEALAHFAKLVDDARGILAPIDRVLMGILVNEARVLLADGQLDRAEANAREALGIAHRLFTRDSRTERLIEKLLESIHVERARPQS